MQSSARPDIAATWRANVLCVVCESTSTAVTRTMPTQRGDKARIRYHRCRICKALFKSVEEIAI